MRTKILQYLLIFISLIALYLFVSDLNKTEAFAARQERMTDRIDTLKDSIAARQERMTDRIDTLKDSIAQLVVDQTENAYFSLDGNRDAQQFHAKFTPNDLLVMIEDKVLAENDNKNGNPMLYVLGKGWIINKVHLVNHQWALVDFTDGSRWGDALLRYDVDAKGQIEIKLLESVLYP
jgi:hypothetical protein